MATGSSTSDVEDILKNEFYFPSFRELGIDNDIDFRYWKEDRTGTWVQACTWCFLGEITNDECSQIPFLRNRVFVQDRKGKDNIPISFYGVFDFRLLKRGHTVCVMLAE